ncbi:MAG TPA: hypothetical protein VKP11_04590 [Frankiaceae bacterium]|nr:hypothetical protein [Frankiaceae bacterium]
MWLLLIPPVAVLLTLLWVSLRSRSRRAPEPLDSVEGYRRSMAAIARRIGSPDRTERVRR